MFCEHSPGFCHIFPVCCKCRCQPVLPAFKDKNRRFKKMHVEKGSEKNAGETRDSVWQGIWRLEVVIHPVTQSSSLAQAVVCSGPLCGCLLSCSFAEDKGRPFNLLIYGGGTTVLWCCHMMIMCYLISVVFNWFRKSHFALDIKWRPNRVVTDYPMTNKNLLEIQQMY